MGCAVSSGSGRLIRRQLRHVVDWRPRFGSKWESGEGQCERLIGSSAVTLDLADPIRGVWYRTGTQSISHSETPCNVMKSKPQRWINSSDWLMSSGHMTMTWLWSHPKSSESDEKEHVSKLNTIEQMDKGKRFDSTGVLSTLHSFLHYIYLDGFRWLYTNQQITCCCCRFL